MTKEAKYRGSMLQYVRPERRLEFHRDMNVQCDVMISAQMVKWMKPGNSIYEFHRKRLDYWLQPIQRARNSRGT